MLSCFNIHLNPKGAVHMSFKPFALSLALCLLSGSLLPPLARAQTPLQAYLQAPMPAWYQERFAQGYLDIPVLMQQGLTRLEAVEVQNHFKDLLEANPDYMQLEHRGVTPYLFQTGDALVLDALQSALERVKKERQFESGFRPQPLKPHEFYVVFDLDETLLTQWYQSGEKGDAYRDLSGLTRDSIIGPQIFGPDYVSMTPGWEQTLLDLSKIPGCKGIVVYTAKEDRAAQDLINRLELGGKPLRGFLKGVFTRNHLVRSSEAVRPSKDLRIIDESLQHVVLIDDNPTRIFPKQMGNLREFPKYNPDVYYAARDKKETHLTRLFEGLLPTVVAEIREAASYSEKKGVSFASAYYPYSMAGSAELLMLLKQNYSMSAAIEFLRLQPEVFEPHFYAPQPQVQP